MKPIRFLILFILLSQCCFAQHWDSLYSGVNRNITCLYEDTVSNKLYVAGIFTEVNHDTIWGIVSWNGSRWDSLKHGIDDPSLGNMPGNTWAITRYGNYLYVGGGFTRAGNLHSPCLARWDGTNWDSVPGGPPNSAVDNIIVYNNELYISGVFSAVGSTSAKGIAKFNGITWQAIGSNYNFNGAISKMVFYHGNLYIGGFFDDPLGNTCRIAKWDGNNWQFMTNSLQGGLADVWDMVVYNNKLYVGGLFYSSSGNAANSIMSWNDTTWSAVGGSIQIGSLNPYPTIKDMCVYNGKLYCAGNFEKVGGVPAMGLASWDGTNWCGYNTFFCNSLLQYGGADQIAFYNDTMYVSGPFLQTDSTTADYHEIAKWVGGNYVDTCGVITTGIHENENVSGLVSFYPNPVNNSATFEFDGAEENRTIIIFDQFGREIWRKESSENKVKFSSECLATGLYFYSVVGNKNLIAKGKFIIQ